MIQQKPLQISAFVFLAVMFSHSVVEARGRGGFGGGRGGGGGFSRGGGGVSRPATSSRSLGGSPSAARSPSYSRTPSFSPTPSYSRPSQSNRGTRSAVSRPTTSMGRAPGSVSFPSSSANSSRIGNRQIGSVDRTPGNRVGDRQIGAVDRTPGNRVGDRQIGSVDRTPANRVGDGKIGAVDRMPRVGDGQLGAVDRTQRDLGKAALPGLVAGSDPGSRLSGDMQDQLSQRRDQFQQNRGSGEYQDRMQSRFENRDEMVGSRRDQLQQRMEDRPESPGERQDYRQDLRDDRREDWQDWTDNDPWHDHWDHDCWHGHFDDYWDHMWDEHPAWSAFRVTTWGVNRASYLFGWNAYYNPYPVPVYTSGSTVIDYSEPLVSSAPMEQYVVGDSGIPAESGAPIENVADAASDSQLASEAPAATSLTDVAVARFDDARASFLEGDYKNALENVDAALGDLPRDATLHEFRSLILFAMQRYRESAAGVHAVLAVGPGMNWTTMSSYYKNQTDYTEQLRALESHIRENPNEADARFLVAYHYITLGHNDAALRQLENVVSMEPKDSVAADLITLLGGEVPDSAAESAEVEFTKASEKELIGKWQADRDGSSFELELNEDGEFSWTYEGQDGNPQTIKGVFVIQDGLLAMEPDSGGVMLADVSKPENGTFQFRQNGTDGGSISFQKN